MEKRHNYVRKVAETAVQLFVSNDKVNVAGMVLAGSADFKTELSQSDMFDPVSLLFYRKLARCCMNNLCSEDMVLRLNPTKSLASSVVLPCQGIVGRLACRWLIAAPGGGTQS